MMTIENQLTGTVGRRIDRSLRTNREEVISRARSVIFLQGLRSFDGQITFFASKFSFAHFEFDELEKCFQIFERRDLETHRSIRDARRRSYLFAILFNRMAAIVFLRVITREETCLTEIVIETS